MNSNEYKPNTFWAGIFAMDLYDYVDKITSNPKKFNDYIKTVEHKDNEPDIVTYILQHDSITSKVRKQAYDICMLAYDANEIDLRKQPWRKKERLTKQEKAITLCNHHLATMQLCQRKFHLSAKRLEHWGRLTLRVRHTLENWNNSDKNRYKNV